MSFKKYWCGKIEIIIIYGWTLKCQSFAVSNRFFPPQESLQDGWLVNLKSKKWKLLKKRQFMTDINFVLWTFHVTKSIRFKFVIVHRLERSLVMYCHFNVLFYYIYIMSTLRVTVELKHALGWQDWQWDLNNFLGINSTSWLKICSFASLGRGFGIEPSAVPITLTRLSLL